MPKHITEIEMENTQRAWREAEVALEKAKEAAGRAWMAYVEHGHQERMKSLKKENKHENELP